MGKAGALVWGKPYGEMGKLESLSLGKPLRETGKLERLSLGKCMGEWGNNGVFKVGIHLRQLVVVGDDNERSFAAQHGTNLTKDDKRSVTPDAASQSTCYQQRSR